MYYWHTHLRPSSVGTSWHQFWRHTILWSRSPTWSSQLCCLDLQSEIQMQKQCIVVDDLSEIWTTHWHATPGRWALDAADSRFSASMRTTPMNDETIAMPPRLQKEPNLSHIGFHRACKLPFLPSSAIDAAVAAPVANRAMITWTNDNRGEIMLCIHIYWHWLDIFQISCSASLYKYSNRSFSQATGFGQLQ